MLFRSGSSNTNVLNNVGYGNGTFTWYQSSTAFQTWNSSWASFLISNHGDGSTYYNQTIIMPFWGPPQYMRKEGGTNTGPWTFITTENASSSTVGYATSAGSATNATSAGYATNAGSATNAGYASNASAATNAGYATNAGNASTVSTIGATQVTNLYSPNGASVVNPEIGRAHV